MLKTEETDAVNPIQVKWSYNESITDIIPGLFVQPSHSSNQERLVWRVNHKMTTMMNNLEEFTPSTTLDHMSKGLAMQ